MIGDGAFQTQLATCEKLLNALDILEERNLTPNKNLGASDFKNKSYREIYFKSLKEYAYDFRLKDQALMLFVKSGNNEHDGILGFSYYECPTKIVTYEEFIGREFNKNLFDQEFYELIENVGDELRYDYEEYIDSEDSKAIVTPVRYDYKATDFGTAHPASHIHFGFDNNIRVGTNRIMNPISFTLFIIRQMYPKKWKPYAEDQNSNLLCRNVREIINEVHSNYRKAECLKEIALT